MVRFFPVVLRRVVLFGVFFGWRRSGSTVLPVERFHSSYCSSVILPSTSSCANFRRCALLLKGIKQRLANANRQPGSESGAQPLSSPLSSRARQFLPRRRLS